MARLLVLWLLAEREMHGEDQHAKVIIGLVNTYAGATRAIHLRAARLDESGHAVARELTLIVNITKWLEEGQHIPLAGQGSACFGGGRRATCCWRQVLQRMRASVFTSAV